MEDAEKIGIRELRQHASRYVGRAIDAVHVATAGLIREDVDVLVSYDRRMLAAAEAYGLPTACPT